MNSSELSVSGRESAYLDVIVHPLRLLIESSTGVKSEENINASRRTLET